VPRDVTGEELEPVELTRSGGSLLALSVSLSELLVVELDNVEVSEVAEDVCDT